MISMSKAYSIRQLRMEGDSIAEISRKLEVSRDTVYKYLAMGDLSQSESTSIALTPFTPPSSGCFPCANCPLRTRRG